MRIGIDVSVPKSPRWRVAPLATLVLSLIFGGCDTSMEPIRTVPARLSESIEHRPCLLHGIDACGGPTQRQRLRYLEALERLDARPTRDPVDWAALVLGVGTDVTTVDRVLAELQQAEDAASPPGVATALGATHHARHLLTGSWLDAIEGLEFTLAALERRPDDSAAQFNQVLFLRALHLCRLLEQAYDEEPIKAEREWFLEAEQVRRETPCAGAERDAGRLFPQVTSHVLAGRTLANTSIAAIADEIAMRTGDSTALELVRAVERGGEDALRELGLFATAASTVRQSIEPSESLARLANLRAATDRLGESVPEAFPFAVLRLALEEIDAGEFTSATNRLEMLRTGIAPSQRPFVAGRIAWIAGLAAVRAGVRGRALEEFGLAQRTFASRGFLHSAAAAESLIAETRSELSLDEGGWSSRVAALAALQTTGASVALHNTLIEGARAAQLLGHTRVGDLLLDEADLLALEMKDTVSMTEIELRRGDIEVARGSLEAAIDEYESALAFAEALEDELFRAKLTANAHFGILTTGRATPVDWPRLDSLEALYAHRGPQWRYVETLRMYATLQSSVGRGEDAAQTFRKAFDALFTQVERTGTSVAARDFWNAAQGVFDAALTHAMSADDPEYGLRILSMARDFEGGSQANELELGSLHDSPPLIALTIVGDELLWWRADVSGVVGARRAAPNLGDRVSRFRESLRSRRFDRAEARALYELVLSDALEDVEGTVDILADGPLAGLPFSALVNPQTGTMLGVERPYALVASMTGKTRRNADQTAGRLVLAVGDPGTLEMSTGWPPRLEGAAAEARAVFDIYGEAGTLLTEGAATVSAVSSALRTADVFHFAGHAQVDSAGTAVLFLADDSGVLIPHSVAHLLEVMDGPAPQLAVLSACETLDPRPGRSFGFVGPARPFLDAGTQTVVGTLWETGDAVISPLMVTLHRAIAEGADARSALRQTLQDQADAQDGVCCDWASVQVVHNRIDR